MWPDAQARDSDLDDLRSDTLGVTLATLLPPDAPPSVVRAVGMPIRAIARALNMPEATARRWDRHFFNEPD